MFFKNLQTYRIPVPFPITADELDARLQEKKFSPCCAFDTQQSGWVSPRENDQMVHAVQGQMLLAFVTEKKILPGSVITRIAREKAKEIETQQGFKPGRKQFKEIKEAVTDELLAKALTTQQTTRVLIDTVNGWLMMDCPSAGRAADIYKALLGTVGDFPAWTAKTKLSPASSMTDWLANDEAPENFTIDRDCELVNKEGKASVRFKNQALDVEDIRRHIASGKQCVQLAMTFADRASFVLTSGRDIKRITPLDILQESNAALANDEERFDADLLIMADTFNKLLLAVIEALGGEEVVEDKQEPMDYAPPAENEPDPLYEQAVTIVLTNKRPSISTVQRHLRIGYNRAARLLEQMEQAGLVSAMDHSGNREILIKEAA